MTHIISSDALNSEVKHLKESAKKFYNHYRLTYKGFNIETHESGKYSRITLLFDNEHGERLTHSSVI